MKILKLYRKLRDIAVRYDNEIDDLKQANVTLMRRIRSLEEVIAERTNIAVDVNFESANHVIIVGRYKNADYVQVFDLPPDDIGGLIDRLKDMERYGRVKRVDAPHQLRRVFSNEFNIIDGEAYHR